ncbi:MAG: hypothetical protein ACOX3L_05980 [Lutisporaceae bacterium]
MVGKDGSIISSVGRTRNLLINSSGGTRIQSIIKEAIFSGRTITGTELIETNDRRDKFTLMQYVVVPVMEDENSPIGGIVTSMDLAGDENITEKIRSDTGMYSVISAMDRIITSNLESGLYRFKTGDNLPEDIRMEILEKGAPLVRREHDNAYFGAFRAIRDKEGRIIGVQGILSHNHLVEAILGQ